MRRDGAMKEVASRTPQPEMGFLYLFFHAAMVGMLGLTMIRFVDLFEPNRRLAQILKILVLATGALSLMEHLPS